MSCEQARWSARARDIGPRWLGAWLHLTVSFMVWLLFGALAIAIGEELQLSATQRSILVALPLLGGALLRIIAGWACDWYGAKRTGLLVLGLQLIAVSWAALGGTSYAELLGIGLLLGAGGASFAVAMPVASRAYPTAHQGLVLGLVASGNIGTVLILFLGSPMGICPGVAWRLWDHAAPSGADSRSIRHSGARRASCSLHCRWHLVAGGGRDDSCPFGLLALSDLWHHVRRICRTDEFSSPVLLHDHYGSDPIVGGSIAALCGLMGESSFVRVGGYVADRWGGLRVLVAVFVALALMSLLTALLPALAGPLGCL